MLIKPGLAPIWCESGLQKSSEYSIGLIDEVQTRKGNNKKDCRNKRGQCSKDELEKLNVL
jgi:hypothetical protein